MTNNTREFCLVPKLHLGTRMSPQLHCSLAAPMSTLAEIEAAAKNPRTQSKPSYYRP